MVINFIQDLATPHNNTLLKALNERADVKLNIWYAYEKASQYNWAQDFTNEIKKARIFGYNRINWSFIRYVLTHKDEKFFIIGWKNHTIRVLIPFFWLLRYPYSMWFDLPRDNTGRSSFKTVLREVFYYILKKSKTRIFCVGSMTVDYFKNRGFSQKRLINLPIFVDITKTKQDYGNKREEILNKYNIKDGDLFLTAGSRLIYEKGFDLLIDAINLLSQDIKKKTKTLIIGSGEEKANLLIMIKKYGLEKNILIEDWMEIDDFMACIANSDVFVHPARFDAYGGTIFAMSVDIPVIGSKGAGAAVDRIVDGQNGYLFDIEDVKSLAGIIEYCYLHRELFDSLNVAARKTAAKWSPEIGAQTIVKALVYV
jgi:glycosyltransferase involved in cell wall biosynthesis